MSTFNRKRISISQVEAGMELAQDAIDNHGIVLIPKDTVLSENHIFRIKLYQIMSVVIKERLTQTPQESMSPRYQDVVQEVVDFDNALTIPERFKKTYSINETRIKDQLRAIGEGNLIDTSELYGISLSLFDSLRTKNELFNILAHLKIDDDVTYAHSLNVSMLCHIFGGWLKLTSEEIKDLTIAGLLHDIGKTLIDPSILNKPGRLTPEEFNIVKTHSRLGYEAIKNQSIPPSVKSGILMHHERVDGSGYPLGLKDTDIPQFAKIIAIADIYDAMTSNRVYHSKFSPFTVLRMFEQESFGLLDTHLLFVFLENIAHNYLGEKVRLSTGEEGTVIFIHNTSPSSPMVQIGDKVIDLNKERHLTIESLI